jgi:EmrB/QacA subfamily drug resistance transporter
MSDSLSKNRWLALLIVCLGNLMIVLDVTIVGVALPSIQADLGFSASSLAWVANIYLLTFGGFLLLAGRLGDLYGHRRLFLIGIATFTLASLGCGLATSPAMLIGGRAIQGLGGAIVSAVALSLVVTSFTEPAERARAMGVFGFVAAGGGSIGVLLSGVMTGLLSWHWIFLVNVPIGVLVFVLAKTALPGAEPARTHRPDVAGAALITASLTVAVLAVTNGVLGLLLVAGALLVGFVWWESRVAKAAQPLVPLSLLRRRNLTVSNVVGMLWAAAMFAWFFLSALYLQSVLGYSPLQVGLAFLPANVIMAVLSLGLSAKLVLRLGIRASLATGLLLAAAGLALFARAPVDGGFADVLPAMVLLGLGSGMAFNPLLLAAMSDVDPADAGLASGIVNTSFMMGGALGLAILAGVAASWGFHAAFLAGALFALVAALLSVALPKREAEQPVRELAETRQPEWV